MKKFLLFGIFIVSASQLHAAAGLEAFPVAGVEKRKARKAAERSQGGPSGVVAAQADADDEPREPFDARAVAFSPSNVLRMCSALQLPYLPGLEKELEKRSADSCQVTRSEFKNGRMVDRFYTVSLMGAFASVAYSSPEYMERKLQAFVRTAITECSQPGLEKLDSIKKRLDALHAERIISFFTAIHLKACPQIVYGALQMYSGFHEQFEKDIPALMVADNRVDRDNLARRLRTLEDCSENYMKHLQGLPSIGGLGRLSDCGFN